MAQVQSYISPVNVEERRKTDIRTGDTVRVWVKVKDKDKVRTQPFEGVVLARKHGSEEGATFTVRRVTGGYGVEKIFPLYSPIIDKIEVIKRARTRRSKLYYIREKAAREIKRQMRRVHGTDFTALESEKPEEAKAPTSPEGESESRPESVGKEPKIEAEVAETEPEKVEEEEEKKEEA